MSITDLTEGQTFTVTESGSKFEGRTMTVKTLGASGRTLLAIDSDKSNKVFLSRNADAVEIVR